MSDEEREFCPEPLNFLRSPHLSSHWTPVRWVPFLSYGYWAAKGLRQMGCFERSEIFLILELYIAALHDVSTLTLNHETHTASEIPASWKVRTSSSMQALAPCRLGRLYWRNPRILQPCNRPRDPTAQGQEYMLKC